MNFALMFFGGAGGIASLSLIIFLWWIAEISPVCLALDYL